MNKIEYNKVLDLQWTLSRAEIAAKREWDEVVQYGKDDLLYELRYKDVKEIRDARKSLEVMIDLLRNNEQLQYTN